MDIHQSKNTKWLVLIGTIIAQIGLGSFYTWSLANKPLATLHGWEIKDVVLSFSIAACFLAIGTLFSGKLQSKFGLKKVVFACGIVLGAALIIAPRMNSLPLLYIFAGILLGLADGIAYVLTLSNALKWFPEKKGLISGISVGSYGVGSILFTSYNSYLFAHYNTKLAFLIWGVTAAILIVIGSILIKEAILSLIEIRDEKHTKLKNYTIKDLFSTKESYLLFIAFFGSCVTGLYLIGSAATIGVKLGHISVTNAALSVTLIAIFNTLGRLIYGFLSDKLGRKPMAIVLFIVIIIALLILLLIPVTFSSFLVALSLIALCFGGGFTIYPSIVADYFGLRNHSRNYGIIYQCFAVAGIFSGVVGAFIGSYKEMFIILLAFCILSLIIMIFIKEPKRNFK